MPEIRQVAVIGSGVMGSGIAAHVANSGTPVLLLDIVPAGAENRNQLAEAAVTRMLAASPSPFAAPEAARLVSVGNLEDHLSVVAEADWIVEAVLERLDVKQDVYRKLEGVRKDGSIVSTNTSTLPLHVLIEGMPERFRRDFTVAHFFNPPRLMRLLELLGGPETRPEAVETLRDFCDVRLGKGVVPAKDTPGFLANRVGVYWMMAGLLEALRLGVRVEEADATMKVFGIPGTGVFGLFDLIGIDLIPHIARAMMDNLPEDDDFRRLYRWPEEVQNMVAQGYTGRKGKGGFTRQRKEEGKRIKEVLNLATWDYEAPQKPTLAAKSPRALLEASDYAWAVLSRTFVYAASLVPEISEEFPNIDRAMELGYAWAHGPFALMDTIGVSYVAERLAGEGRAIPPLLDTAVKRGGFYASSNGHARTLTRSGDYVPVVSQPGVLRLADLKARSKPLRENPSAALWEMGDGVLCFEHTAKMYTFDEDVFALLHTALDLVPTGYKGLVIGHDGDLFSAGANLHRFVDAAKAGDWAHISDFIKLGQSTFAALKFAPFPVVTALYGQGLGGGCEIHLQADAVQAHLEAYSGLVEKNVGIIPGWGGTVSTLLRHWDEPDPQASAMKLIMEARVSTSAYELHRMRVTNERSRITMNRDRLLADARALCLDLARGYAPPSVAMLELPGQAGREALLADMPAFEGHDEVIRQTLATVLCGGAGAPVTLSEMQLRGLEHDGFMELIRCPAAIERMEKVLG